MENKHTRSTGGFIPSGHGLAWDGRPNLRPQILICEVPENKRKKEILNKI